MVNVSVESEHLREKLGVAQGRNPRSREVKLGGLSRIPGQLESPTKRQTMWGYVVRSFSDD